MASKRAETLALLWLCLGLSHMVVRGRELNPGSIHATDDASEIVDEYAQVKSTRGTYYGTQATISIWQPLATGKQSTGAAIWLSNGHDTSDFNMLAAGWHVYPEYYHDGRSHFFLQWRGAGGTGCYNLQCPGFVATDAKLPGAYFENMTNEEYYTFDLRIYKDTNNGDWVLRAGEIIVGHWPKSIFTSLADTASQIEWGGMVRFVKSEGGPPMGNGKLPWDTEGEGSFFKGVQIFDPKGNNFFGPGIADYTTYNSNQACYSVGGLKSGAEDVYFSFNFGGPGGCVTP